jgi:hypothetical protein
LLKDPWEPPCMMSGKPSLRFHLNPLGEQARHALRDDVNELSPTGRSRLWLATGQLPCRLDLLARRLVAPHRHQIRSQIGAYSALVPLTIVAFDLTKLRFRHRKPPHLRRFSSVGATGFEPATFRPPAECATRPGRALSGCRTVLQNTRILDAPTHGTVNESPHARSLIASDCEDRERRESQRSRLAGRARAPRARRRTWSRNSARRT